MRVLSFALLMFSGLVFADDDPLEFEADFEVGYGYDTNVSVDDVDLSTNVGDQFADLRFSAGLDYETKNETDLSANLTLTEKMYNTFDRFDGSLVLASLSASRDVGKVDLGLDVRYIDYQLDDDGFLDMTQISPTVSWFPSKNTYVRVAYELSEESYDQTDARDNDRHEVGVSFYYFINGLRNYFTVQAQVSEEDADDEVFSNGAWQFRLTYNRKFKFFGTDSTFKLGYRYQERDYEDAVNPGIGDFRKDERDRYEIELDVPLNEQWSVVTEIIANDYDSNLDSADYTQEVYQVTIKYEF